MTLQDESAQAKILFVDDEPNILSSLRRLFRPQGYQVFTAESGHAGLEVLETEKIDLVISDMRMPEMDGACFLEHVRSRWPQTIRLLLTGYADIQSILDAINKGEIYRYITKPWDDNDILLIVRHALEQATLKQEKQRLERLTQQQNEELKTLNATLEAKVEERTKELKQAHNALIATNGKLKVNFLTSIKVFSSLIEMRGAHLAGHSRRVADLVRKIAVRLGLDARETQEIFIAALLHNIGKVSFSDELLAKPVSLMNGEQLGIYRKHPLRAEQLLMPLEDLHSAAIIVRSQLERFDGEGFPEGLSGFNIPMGARILALASDYSNLQIGTLTPKRLRPEEAQNLILQARGKRYDPQVTNAFHEVLSGHTENLPQELVLKVVDLKPGMMVTRDVVSRDGFLLLSADHTLDERLIQQIMEFDRQAGTQLTVCVRPDKKI